MASPFCCGRFSCITTGICRQPTCAHSCIFYMLPSKQWTVKQTVASVGVRGGKSRQLKGLAGHHSHLTQCTQVSRGGRTKGGKCCCALCAPCPFLFIAGWWCEWKCKYRDTNNGIAAHDRDRPLALMGTRHSQKDRTVCHKTEGSEGLDLKINVDHEPSSLCVSMSCLYNLTLIPDLCSNILCLLSYLSKFPYTTLLLHNYALLLVYCTCIQQVYRSHFASFHWKVCNSNFATASKNYTVWWKQSGNPSRTRWYK